VVYIDLYTTSATGSVYFALTREQAVELGTYLIERATDKDASRVG